jgi:hypothetical protein
LVDALDSKSSSARSWFDSGHGIRSFSAVIRQRPQKACLSLS